LSDNDMLYMLSDEYIDQDVYSDGKRIASQRIFKLLDKATKRNINRLFNFS